MFDWEEFLNDVAGVSRGDYASGFKMLGVVLYVKEHGIEPLLSGGMVSQRTAYRWLDTIRRAGWGSLISEVRVLQAIREHLASLPDGEANRARESLTHLLDVALSLDGAVS
jgi:hypothetical protein